MPKLTGIFDDFPDLDQIPPDAIAHWLKPNPGITYIENYIGNKLLYPQTVPVTQSDLAIELSILRELIRRHPKNFQSQKKLFIPEELFNRLPNLPQLCLTLVDGLAIKDIAMVQLDKKLVGTVIKPDCPWPGSKFNIEVLGKIYKFKKNSLTTIPLENQAEIHFIGQNAELFGKTDTKFKVAGGSLGVLIDGRGYAS